VASATIADIMTPSSTEVRDALLADNVRTIAAWLAGGMPVDLALDERGATPLFFACTPRMVETLLTAGADPAKVLAGDVSALDAAAREGQVEIVRLLLRAAPQLATEARMLLAVDHARCEAMIRAVARGETVDSIAEPMAAPLVLRRAPTCVDPRAPAPKGAQRFHFPHRPGHVPVEEIPAWAVAHASDATFAGPNGALLVFRDHEPPVLVAPSGATTIDVPPVGYPYEHAFSASGTHFFFGYGQTRVIGIELATGERVVELDLPGGPWGSVMITASGESPRGHTYPLRVAVAGGWLAVVSLERIYFLPFGELAGVPSQWFTCQLGTCVTSVLDHRALIVGARAGSAVYGVSGRRLVKLSDLIVPSSDEDSALLGHLRMVLRVSGRGHDDPRSFTVEQQGNGTNVIASGVAGFDLREKYVPRLVIDPADLDTRGSTTPEIVDAFELEGQVHVRVSPIGRDDSRDYVVDGIASAWRAAFEPRATTAPLGDGLAVLRSPIPAPYDPPHPRIDTLSYPTIGPTGYAVGFRVSARPGLWNTYIADAAGVKPLEPHWFNGVTHDAFHDVEPRLVMASGVEAIEIDLLSRTWTQRTFTKPVRGVCYFESGIAVQLVDELLLVSTLVGPVLERLPTTARAASLASFSRHRVLWVPTAGDHNVFLARRRGALVVVGVLRAAATGRHLTPEGDFLALDRGALRLASWDSAIVAAPELPNTPLDQLVEPRVSIVG
jgi:hypothetical protein